MGNPVAGSVVYEGDRVLGITGSGAFGKIGSLKSFGNRGTFQGQAKEITEGEILETIIVQER